MGYYKPARLVEELRALYKIGQGKDDAAKKLTAVDMYECMKAKRDVDGSLFFCWTKRGRFIKVAQHEAGEKCVPCGFSGKGTCNCNGALLNHSQIDSWIHTGSH